MVAPSRHRLHRATATRRRLPALVTAAAVGAATSLMLPVAATVAACILVGTLALRRRRSAARCTRAAEAAVLQSALDILVGELRVGAHPVVAFDVAAGEVDGTVATGLHAVAARARLGADVAGGPPPLAPPSPPPPPPPRPPPLLGVGRRGGVGGAAPR